MDDTNILSELNEAQHEAVTTTEGYVRVIAGAGSGKTRALTHRFAYLVNEIGIMPGNILCVTFTNKAANEMRARIRKLTGDNDTGFINTFHGFCVSVLQEESYAVGYPKSFLTLDNSDINEMLKTIYEERNLSLRDMTFSRARDMIEMIKCVEKPDYVRDLVELEVEELKGRYDSAKSTKDIIFYGYLYQERKCFGFDYNDLLFVTLHIFREREEIRQKWQERLEYIMIDEFQDIDPPQYELMEALSAHHKNLFIVGDPDQTIYTWRGANVAFLLEFEKKHPGTKTIMMLDNYRSTPQVVAVANSLISANHNRIKKDLVAKRWDGAPVVWNHAKDPDDEAAWIVSEINNLRTGMSPYCDEEFREEGAAPLDGRNHYPVKLGRIAILYRAHHVSRVIEEALQQAEIPYTIYSGVQFFDRAEIKDMLSYLRMLVYKDDLSFKRIVNVPKRNIGDRRMRFLEEYAKGKDISLYEALKANTEHELIKGTGALRFIDMIEDFSAAYANTPISDLFLAVADRSGYLEMLRTEGSQERLDNLAELSQCICEYEFSCGEEARLEDYLQHVALFTNSDMDDKSDRVKLMTVHAAKGLEFPYVFLCGMNEGIFPGRRVDTMEGMEEERRIAFVAVTRAMNGLYLTEAEGRNHDSSPRYPSRFLLDIDRSLVQTARAPSEELVAMTARLADMQNRSFYAAELIPLEVGTVVEHVVFGRGVIRDVDREKLAYRIHFDALGTERSISFKVKLKEIE
ncbi:MAG: UvrD-helicase domain-containing protein [Lachnospiraceae bacterium]|nr:UvrD-helicase domain-containing protein [Lachnospiraceae bacterium]